MVERKFLNELRERLFEVVSANYRFPTDNYSIDRRIEKAVDDTAEKISRRGYCKAIAAGALATYIASNLPLVKAQENGTAQRPALIKWLIDGGYTPLDSLQLTPLGEEKVAESNEWMPKDEWDDGDERVLSIFSLSNVPRDYPKGYFRSKFFENRFSMLVDIVSDKSIQAGDFMYFIFDTQNTGIGNPKTPGVYCLWLRYTNDSPDSLISTTPTSAQLPGNPFPKNTVKFKSSLGQSPHSLVDHKLVEAEFDLNLLTKYSKNIGFNFRSTSFVGKKDSGYSGAYDLKYNPAPYESIYFSDQTVPIPEVPLSWVSKGLAIALAAVYGFNQLVKREKQ